MSTLYCAILNIRPYTDKLLAIDKKSYVKKYCKNVRGLCKEEYKLLDINEYLSLIKNSYNASNMSFIINSMINDNTINDFYDTMITNNDYNILVDDTIMNIETLKTSLSTIDNVIDIYKNMILEYGSVYNDLISIKDKIGYSIINDNLYNKILKSQKDTSPLFSPDINEYMNYKLLKKDILQLSNRYHDLINNDN